MWTIPDHEASAVEALARGIISGSIDHLAEVPEPQQSSEHQARVSSISILNQLGGPLAVVEAPWSPGWPPIEVPTDPPVPTPPPIPPDTGDDDAPPPSGMFIPVLQGPILSHDGNPEVLGSMTFRDGLVHNFDNVLIRGNVRAYGGSVVNITNSELDGAGGQYCTAGWGGTINLTRCEVWNAEDGCKDSVNTEQVTIHKLFNDGAAHGDCVQMQSSGGGATHKWSYFDAYYGNGSLANATFMVKNDLGDGAPQHITVEDSYINGGNYTVFLKTGPKGPAPADSHFRRVLWGGNSRYGVLSSNSPAPGTWDVTPVNI